MAKVLIVEDDSDYRELLSEVISSAGISVTAVGTGDEGLEKIQSEADIDLIILDIFMPGMDGMTFYHKLMGLVKRNIRVIILTNLPMSKENYPTGVEEVFIKSNTTLDQVLARVKALLNIV